MPSTSGREGDDQPLVTQVARADFRPYLHPLMAPDGQGVMTESQPPHHPHQTGIFWGLTRLNGRDYFHHPEGDHWKRVSVAVLKARSLLPGDSVQWQAIYDLLDENAEPILRHAEIWTMRDQGGRYSLDLQWSGQALRDVTVGQYDYGGLFVRMPWRPGMTGEVVNSARKRDSKAEGQRAVWLDVGLQLEGRQDLAHFAILDHPLNAGFLSLGASTRSWVSAQSARGWAIGPLWRGRSKRFGIAF